MDSRIIIVGGPRTGKSTMARAYMQAGVPVFCGDPRSKAKEIEDGVIYLPEGLAWADGSQYVADNWFSKDGPWICEGQIMARALRKWIRSHPKTLPADRIIVITDQRQEARLLTGQKAMHRSVMTVWSEIRHHFNGIVQYKTIGSHSQPRARSMRRGLIRGRL